MSLLLPKYNKFKQTRQIGEYTISLPDPVDLNLIANKDLTKEKQKFYVTPLPKDIDNWDKATKEKFEEQEWDRRRNGYWFWNNGELEYLTGTHYLYVNWWKIDIGLPSFIDCDRDFYYWWKFAVKDNPVARGGVYITNRREGKTWKATSILYDELSQTPNSHGGIQSKSDTDGSGVFNKLTFSWRKMPYFFKPMDIGESHPKSKLEFMEPSRRDTKNQKKEYGLVLDSWIDYENAKEEAYDGQKLLCCIQDEIGKTVNNNVLTRMEIVKECVMDGTDIVGKILGTTTVEEMEKKGGENCKKIWDKCDPNNLLPNGETQIGLLRYFKPAYYGFRGKDEKGKPFVDEYGYSDVERTKEYLQRRRDALKGTDSLVSERRKYPFDIRDCFINDSTKTFFDVTKIEQQIRYNETIPNIDQILIRGNFQWKDGIKDTEVVWVNNPEGKWTVTWLPKAEDRNKSVLKYGKKAPANKETGCFGTDPYDNKLTVDNRKSDAASYGYRKFDVLDPEQSGNFVTEYLCRPKQPEIFWEDMIMQCVFFGWEMLVENNRIGTVNYFRMRGYYEYLMDRPGETEATFSKDKEQEKGIPMSGEEARMQLLYATESFISNKVGMIEEEGKQAYIGKLYFNKLLQCWWDFDFGKKWTEFDAMVGAGLAILGSRKAMPKKVKQETLQFFKTYKYVGGVAVENRPKKN